MTQYQLLSSLLTTLHLSAADFTAPITAARKPGIDTILRLKKVRIPTKIRFFPTLFQLAAELRL